MQSPIKIPFNKPFIVGKELYYISQSVKSGQIAGDGLFTRKCQKFMEKKFNANKILLTTSCTSALEMAAILCNVSADDEVILPSFTFVSTANAFYMRGAKLIFADIKQETLNIDETMIEDVITDHSRVIVPVHYAGVSCEMDKIMDIAHRYNLYVVEDAAQGVNAQYKGKFLGTIGDIGTYSFHETKNIICGEGGAIVINNEALIERTEIIRDKGTNRSKFFRGDVDKYTWVDIGSSYLPSDILAAFLYAQFENMEIIEEQRKVIFNYYYEALTPLAKKGILKLPLFRSECNSNNHIFYILLEDEQTRDALMNYLRSSEILAVFHYLPLHLSPMGRSMGYKEGQFPVTEHICKCLLRLPFYYNLSHEEQAKVITCIEHFFKKRKM